MRTKFQFPASIFTRPCLTREVMQTSSGQAVSIFGGTQRRRLMEESTVAEKGQGNPGNFAEDREKASRAGQAGGQHSSGSFANDHDKASEAGKKGGQASSGGSHDQHVKAGQQSHKNT
jgi:general stress protein YciG